jgi:hypothetical protein
VICDQAHGDCPKTENFFMDSIFESMLVFDIPRRIIHLRERALCTKSVQRREKALVSY